MKNVIVMVVLFFISWTIFGQNKPDFVDIQVGPEIKTNKKEFIDKIIGKDQDGIYVMAKYGDEMTLFYYGNDLSMKRRNSFTLEDGKRELNYRGLVQMDDEFFLFTTHTDNKEKMVYLYSQKLDKSTLTFGDLKELGSSSFEGYKKRYTPRYSFRISADSNYVMFIADLPSESDEPDRFSFRVFDKEMKEVWKRIGVEVEDKEDDFYRYDAQIGNDGKVYILAKVYDSSRKYKKGEINYTFDMLVYSEDEKNPDRFDVTLDNKFMSDVMFSRLQDGNIQVVGFYADQAGLQNGVFNLLIDGESHSVINVEANDFPTDFIVQHASEKEKEKASKKEDKGKEIAFYSYDIDDLMRNPDGSITMVGEQYRFYQTCHTDANGNTSCTNHYVYGNIILVKFDSDGAVEWMELIPKFQHTTNDGGYYSGYALAQLEDGSLNLIYNDNPKNNFFHNNQRYYTWSRSKSKTDIIMYTIQLDGKLNRYTLFNSETEEVMSRPKVSVQIDSDEIIVLGEAKKTTKLYKVRFE